MREEMREEECKGSNVRVADRETDEEATAAEDLEERVGSVESEESDEESEESEEESEEDAYGSGETQPPEASPTRESEVQQHHRQSTHAVPPAVSLELLAFVLAATMSCAGILFFSLYDSMI